MKEMWLPNLLHNFWNICRTKLISWKTNPFTINIECLSCQFVAALSKSWYQNININLVIHQKNIMGINKCISMSLTTEHNKNYIECVLCQHLSWHILLVISSERFRLVRDDKSQKTAQWNQNWSTSSQICGLLWHLSIVFDRKEWFRNWNHWKFES